MHVALIYFSGTGNTAMVAGMIQKHFASSGSTADMINADDYLTSDGVPDLSVYDLIGIGYPIHAFSVPLPFLRWLFRLPESGGQRVFIFKSAGEPFPPNNSSSLRLIRILTQKGYHVVFERHFLMPYNIMFRYPDALVKQMVLTNDKLAEGMMNQILSGSSYRTKAGLYARTIGFLARHIKDYGVMLNGACFRANPKKCTLCMRCVHDCPVNNIRRKDASIRFGWRCMLCMRCVMGCPENAISISILSGWVLHGYYDFQRILNDESISPVYVDDHTKGYFKTFRKYYRWAAERISEEI